jgi:ATP-dependent Clp protease ATP-binding subunit ClpC
MVGKNSDISQNFSGKVLNLLLDACEYAHEHRHHICTSLHLLRVVLNDELVMNFFQQQDVDQALVKQKTELFLRNSQLPFRLSPGKVFFSPDLKIVLLQSYLNALKKNPAIVDLEDVFFALLNNTHISKILGEVNISPANIEKTINKVQPSSALSDAGFAILERYTQNLLENKDVVDQEIIVDREKELAQMTRILVRKTKNNVILVGEQGVGRGAIVHLMVQNIKKGIKNGQIQFNQVLELNLAGLASAIVMRNTGELSHELLEEISKFGNVILFIRNFEVLTDEMSIEKMLAVNIVKTIISIEGVRLICSMSSASYRKLIAKESALSEQFEMVKVNEPSIEVTIAILSSIAEKLSRFHKISIESQVIELCATLAKRYIQEKFLPSKAIDLLDEVCSKVVLENRKEVSVDDVKTVISEKTGIPIEKLTVTEQKKLIDLEKILSHEVIGQEEAIRVVSDVIRRSRAGLKDPKKPIGSFLFLGPSGVGKTFLAKNLAKIVYDNENAMIRLDMSEFSEPHTVQRLIGSPPGYIGYEEGGQLTNPIWERPYSLILLDEIEKAHPKVFDIFLQVLDEGRLTDGQGRTVDFKNTILIATSNIASEEILDRLESRKDVLTGFDREKFYDEYILPILKQYFRPEFINRFDEIVVFHPLTLEELEKIARIQIQKTQERLVEKNIQLIVSDERLKEYAQRSYNPSFGARPLIRLLQEQVENMLARKIISGEIKEGETVHL